MKSMQPNEKGETLLELLGYVMLVIITMSITSLTIGSLLDNLLYRIDLIPISLSSWGTAMMEYPHTWARYAFYVPTFAVIIVMVWAIKTVIRRKDYTTATGEFKNTEEEV